jgi:hypothetical protein
MPHHIAATIIGKKTIQPTTSGTTIRRRGCG